MFDRIKKMFRRTVAIRPQNFSFERSRVPSCCQAFIIHNLHYRGDSQGNFLSPELVEGMKMALVGGEFAVGRMHLAITSSDQVTAETIFRETGFDPVHEWRARTGSYLTLWVYKP